MSELIYLLYVLMFFVGLVLGFSVGRASRSRKEQAQNMERAIGLREELRRLTGNDSNEE